MRHPRPRFMLRWQLLASILILCLAAATPSVARPLDEVKASGYLRIAVYDRFKPFSWVENGQPRGIDVDIAKRLAQGLGVRPQFFMVRAGDDIGGDLRNGVTRGTLTRDPPGDVMMHVPFDRTLEEQVELLRLFAPYYTDGLMMVVAPSDAKAAEDFSLFERKKVAVDVGSLADFVVVSARDHTLIKNVVHFRGIENAFQAFEQGKVAAFYGVISEIQPLLRKSKRKYRIVHPPAHVPDTWITSLAVRINASDLGYALSDQLDRMRTSGELKSIFARYGVEYRAPVLPE